MRTARDQGMIVVPRELTTEDTAVLQEWLIPDGAWVARGDIVAAVEFSKVAVEVESEHEGFLFHVRAVGERVDVGAPIGVVSAVAQRPEPMPTPARPAAPVTGGQMITKAAQALIDKHGLSTVLFKDRRLVRAEDVQAHVTGMAAQEQPPVRRFGSEVLSPDEDWDAVLASDDYRRLMALLLQLRKRMKAKFNRHVPLGDLLNDRWVLPSQHNFGDGTSVYDECLILGDVVLGKHCWVGPYTILDGNFAPLRIGDYTSIGSGSHIYSHNTIERTLTGGQAEVHCRPTTIGANCFIAPLAIVGPGTILGDCCFVATGSYVQGEFPSLSYIAGNPATKVGHVELHHGRAQLRLDTRHHA